ncbi:MAG: hypothetical protein AB7F82_05595, partial [Alphaproteobacteria bacterium]
VFQDGVEMLDDLFVGSHNALTYAMNASRTLMQQCQENVKGSVAKMLCAFAGNTLCPAAVVPRWPVCQVHNGRI